MICQPLFIHKSRVGDNKLSIPFLAIPSYADHTHHYFAFGGTPGCVRPPHATQK